MLESLARSGHVTVSCARPLVWKSTAWGSGTPCLQNTCGLSDTVAHLGLQSQHVRQDRLASDLVVVRLGGQPSRRCRAPYLRVMGTAEQIIEFIRRGISLAWWVINSADVD
jgi:hypothetical protein